MNKAVIYIPIALVVGGVVGAWGPGEELRTLKARGSAAPAQENKPAEARPAAGFDTFAQTLNIPDSARRAPRRRPGPRAGAAATNAAETASAEAPAEAPPAGEEPRRMSPEDLRARIEEAAELWRARMDVAKAQTVEKLGLDAEGAARFEEALAGMNGKLRDSIQIIADMLADEEAMTPELGVRLMGDLCTTLAESYDDIGQCVPEDRRGEVSGLELHNFIDPSVAEPLVSVQDKLGNARLPGIGRRR